MITRNVRWLGKSYGQYFNKESHKNDENTELESSDDEMIVIRKGTESDEESLPEESQRRQGVITRSKALMDAIDDDSSSDESVEEEAGLLTQENIESEPYTFEDAFYCKDPKKRELWREAIKKEINSMEKCDVWTPIQRNLIPKGRKLIGNRWVFKEKRD